MEQYKCCGLRHNRLEPKTSAVLVRLLTDSQLTGLRTAGRRQPSRHPSAAVADQIVDNRVDRTRPVAKIWVSGLNASCDTTRAPARR